MTDYSNLSHLPDTPPSNYEPGAGIRPCTISELDVHVLCVTESSCAWMSIDRMGTENSRLSWLLRFITRIFRDHVSPGPFLPSPAWSPLWCGPLEAGDTRYLHPGGMPTSSVALVRSANLKAAAAGIGTVTI